jgi:hypothetical protein
MKAMKNKKTIALAVSLFLSVLWISAEKLPSSEILLPAPRYPVEDFAPYLFEALPSEIQLMQATDRPVLTDWGDVGGELESSEGTENENAFNDAPVDDETYLPIVLVLLYGLIGAVRKYRNTGCLSSNLQTLKNKI